MGDFRGRSENKNPNKNVDSKDCAHEVSDGNKDLLGIGLEAMHVTLWQRTCLHFIHDLRIHVSLHFKVID
jgi:hypothetical protein